MKLFINVNFYGHGDLVLSGLRDYETPDLKHKASVPLLQLKRAYKLKVVGGALSDHEPLFNNDPQRPVVFVLNYNAVLGASQEARAKQIFDETMTAAHNFNPKLRPLYMVTGYSAGGVTAIYLGREATKSSATEMVYIGFADAAFYANESDQLMKSSGVKAKYSKNYYQTRGNDVGVAEIHGAVNDFNTNVNLDDQISGNSPADLHEQAVVLGNQRMAEDLKWCVQNC